MYQIRQFEVKDADKIREICLETCTDNKLLACPELLYTLYANYYIEQEPSNVFVAVDSADNCVGYILCAQDCKRFSKVFKREYFPKIKQDYPSFLGMARLEILSVKLFGTRYPAHLHIDLTLSVQRQGVGGMLLTALEQHLTAKGVSGVCLGCSRQNVKGVSFYTKKGFTPLLVTKGSILFGKKLSK